MPAFKAPLAVLLLFVSLTTAWAVPAGKWVEVRTPNFIVVSNAGEAQARKIAVQFEQVRSLFQDSLSYVKGSLSPTITILAVKDEDSLRELLPEYWADKGHAHPAGIFIERYYQFQVALNLSAHGDNPYENLYHEYYHSVTVPYFPGLPTWVAEGLADFWGNSVISGKTADIGVPNGVLIAELRSTPLIPLPELFKVDHNSPYYNEQNKVSIFYAESWALVHYLMLGDKQAHNSAFGAYLGALNGGASQDEAAAKAFGDVRKLQQNLEQYIRGLTFPAIQVTAPAKVEEGTLAARALSPADVDSYCGGFLALHGQFQQAEPLLKEAVQLDSHLALAQRNLALLHYLRKENADALASVSAAVSLDSEDPMARFLRAEWTFEDKSRTDPQIGADLQQALQAKPDFAAAEALLAIYFADVQKLPEAFAEAQKSVSLEPGELGFRVNLARILLGMRRYDDAESQARQIAAATADKGIRSQTDDILKLAADGRAYEARARQRREQEAARAAEASAAQASALPPPTTTTPEKAPQPADTETSVPQTSNGHSSARGVVAQVTCNGNEMEVILKVPDRSAPLVFRAKDRTRIGYSSNTSRVQDDIEPCKELGGHEARLDYKPAEARFFDGELVQITVEK